MGGGGSKSTVKSEVFSKSINEAFMESMQSCAQSGSNIQEIIVTGTGNIVSKVDMSQSLQMTQECAKNEEFLGKMQNDLSNAIKQAAKAQGPAVMSALGKTDSEVETKITHDVRNTVSVSAMQEVASSIEQAQRIIVEGSGNLVSKVKMAQASSAISGAVQKMLNNIDAVNTIKNKIDSEAQATLTNPVADVIDSTGKALANVWSSMTGPMIIFLIAALVGVYIFFSGGDGSPIQQIAEIRKTAGENK